MKYKTAIEPEKCDTVYDCGCFAYSLLTPEGSKAGWIQCTLHQNASELLKELKHCVLRIETLQKQYEFKSGSIAIESAKQVIVKVEERK